MVAETKIGPWTLDEYKHLTTEEIDKHYATGSRSIDMDLGKYINHLLCYKNTLLELEGTELLERTKELDTEIRFLKKVLSALNAATDKKTGEINVKASDELQKLVKEAETKNHIADEILERTGKEIERGKNLCNAGEQRIENAKIALESGDIEKANSMRSSGEALIAEGKALEQQYRKEFEQGNLLKDAAKPVLKLKEFEKINKDNRQYIMANLDSMVEQFNRLRQSQDQFLSELNQKRNTFSMYCKMIAQSLHAIMSSAAKNIR